MSIRTGRGITSCTIGRLTTTSSSANSSSGTATTGNGGGQTTHSNWISPDSKYLLYFTNSSDIAASDTTNTNDTFLLDIATGTSKLITHALGADSGIAIGSALIVPHSLQDTRLSPYSSDGRYILLSTNNATAFASDHADNSNGTYGDDLFLYDIQTGELKLITHAYNSSAVTGNGATEDGVFTADGKYVVFTSYASNLINAGSVGSTANVFLYEIATGTTTLITQNAAGVSANNSSFKAHVSPDGSHLAFYSGASDLNGSNRTSGSGYDIYITDLPSGGTGPANAAPTALTLTNTVSSISEGTSTASHIKIADIGVTDDGQGTNVLSLSGTDAAYFEIVGSALYLKAGTALDHDTKASFSVSILVDDTSVGTTPDLSQLLTLAVTASGGSGPDNAAPTALDFTNSVSSISESTSTASHIKIADIGVTDDGLGTNVLSLFGADAAYFEIVGSALYLKAGTVLDYESKTSYGVTVLVDDTSVGTTPDASMSLTLAVTDVDENNNHAPSFTSSPTVSIAENNTSTTTVTAVDVDAGSTRTFSLAGGADQGRFQINAASGALAFLAAPDWELPADADQNNTYQVVVRVTDDKGATNDQTMVVTVTDVDGHTIVGSSRKGDKVDLAHGPAGNFATDEEDNINVRGGNDTVNAAGGNDTVKGGAGKDSLDGGTGTDTVDFSDQTKAVVLTLNGAKSASAKVGGLTDDTVKNFENIIGGKSNDTLTGDKGSNVLQGGKGNDVLDGGKASDHLQGDAGVDKFVFSAKLGPANVDIIVDFKPGQDKIVLDSAVFKALHSPLTDAEFYAKAGATTGKEKGDHIIYDKATGDLYYDKDGKGGAAALQFATLVNHPSNLDHDDFIIV